MPKIRSSEDSSTAGRRTKKAASSSGLPAAGSAARLPKRISPSRMKDFMQCERLFFYKTILWMEDPSTIHTTRGTLAHTAFERIFDHPQGERVPEDAVAYVRPAWKVMQHPLAERSEVEAGTPEARIRDESESWRDLVKPDSKDEKRMLKSAADYAGLCARHAATSGQTEAEVEEELLSTAEDMVRSWFLMENPNNFTPDGREIHVQATTLGVTMHGFIDRLDKWVTRAGEERVFVSDYKALELGTPLPTPSGWTTMGEVQVGDELFGADGRPTVVLGKSEVFHDRPCYEIQFDDKSTIVADAEHLWQVSYGLSNRTQPWVSTVVVTTEQLVAMKADGKCPIWIDNAKPLQLPDPELPLDPWVLGAWLGDGHTTQGYLDVRLDDVADMTALLTESGEHVADQGHPSDWDRGMTVLAADRRVEGMCIRGHHRAANADCRRCDADRWTGFPTHDTLANRLRHIGVLGNKHVPATYLRGSYAQRLSLLQGLMDTDGSWNSQRNQAVFSTTLPALAEAVEELVHSLGGHTSRVEKPYKNKVQSDRSALQVMFTPAGYNPFRLPRKADLVRTETPRKAERRCIRTITPVDSVPTQCVKVAAADSLFLAGRQMVPTHNTGKVPGEGKTYRPHVMQRIEDEAWFAMKIYALLYWEIHKVVPYQLRLIYVKKGDKETGIKRLNVTAAMLNETRKEIAKQWRFIKKAAETENWKTKTGPLCNYCTFQKICPAFGGQDELLPQMKELRGEPVIPEETLFSRIAMEKSETVEVTAADSTPAVADGDAVDAAA